MSLPKPSAGLNLQWFSALASPQPQARLDAATALLKHLESEEAAKEDADYIVSRLIKGLASGRGGARLGFSVALTEVLSTVAKGQDEEGWTVERLIEEIQKWTKGGGNITGQEQRDFDFGRLFGLQSLVNARILDKFTLEAYTKLIGLLFALSNKKVWLRELASFVMMESVRQLPGTTFGKEGAKLVLDKVASAGMGKTVEGVGIVLALRNLPDGQRPKIGAEVGWKDGNPLNTSNSALLAKVLKEVTTEETQEEPPKEDEQKKGKKKKSADTQKGNWKPKLHFVWPMVLDLYSPKTESTLPPSSLSFADFWRVTVDEGLFSEKSSLERKFWGFQLVEMAAALDVPMKDTLTKNILRTIINHAADNERYLHKAAKRSLSAYQAYAESHPSEIAAMVKCIVGKNGTPNFDRITKSKLVETIMPMADAEGLKALAGMFLEMIRVPGLEEEEGGNFEKAVETRRQWAIDQILSLIRSGKTDKTGAWVGEVIEFWAIEGHFGPKDGEERKKKKRKTETTAVIEPVFTTATRNVMRARLGAALKVLISHPPADNDSWPARALQAILTHEASGASLIVEFNETVSDERDAALKMLEKIHKKKAAAKEDKKEQLASFELLYALVILQIYDGDAEAVNVVGDLKDCYEKVFSKEKKAGHKHKHHHHHEHDHDHDHEHEDEPEAIEVLTDILLSFMSKNSALLRKLAEQIFTTFVDKMNESSLVLLTEVLETKESKEGSEEMFDQEGDEDMEEGDEEEDDWEDEGEMDNEDDEDEDEDNEDEDEEDNDEGDEAAERNAALDKALSDALGAAGADVDMDDEMPDEDSEEELMDDDQMMALDDHLATIFKERSKSSSKKQTKKKEAKETKEQIIHFKNRVLDLIEIFCKTQSANPLSIELILPLLKVMRTTTSSIVADKAAGIIRTKLCKKDLPTCDKVRVLLILEQVHQEAAKTKTPQASAACSQCSLLLAKLCFTEGMDENAVSDVVAVYANSLSEWLVKKNSKIQPGLFFDFVNWGQAKKGQGKGGNK
ncbi:DNA polymerase V [Saitoella complicata NRRL Y-17804]|uniref:DNA polymerase V n=1 Tax=Saitoella complicata (strain BCRC 22490 / CBS 7301 / JCM 7358 / NBRC 10748 / NRRL Y-17804) TaxID=698492 RepID=A0A0E9NJ17_SAICN|nr:DNA polymerase V [Saitoella complicata NRRL Y-17804]ODQ49994.1 DNA polymerase V [Saitoella complicata NRRL Y-17804]GAO49686.1 hypothetical protein G7K_3832-t1 [Saitoella complicata NRRL Y-17804]